MKRIIIMAAMAVFVLGASLAFAADAPELRGTWKGDSYLTMEKGFKKGATAWVIDHQEGQLFKGYRLWFNGKGELKKEAFVGIFGDDGKLYFADKDDGYTFGHRTGKQTMTLYYLERGATFKAILSKLERVHFTTGFVEIDKDGDTMIMRAEIANHYPLNAERIMQEADKNKDGKLTKDEWEAWKKINP